MKECLLLLILLFSWLLGSCRALGTSPETPTPVITSSFQATQSLSTATTATPTPRPTGTVAPTETPIMPSATATIVGTIVAISEPMVYTSHLSHDGKWQAEVVIYDCVPVGEVDEFAYEQLNLIQTANDSTEIADSQLQSCGGLGAFGLAGLFWSQNSQYFYYTNAREGVPDGCGYWEPPFLRLDVSNLETQYLGGGTRSTDETKLATWQGWELVVWDVNEGEIARILAIASDAEAGPITWSPDSQALVYVQFESSCPVSGISYVVRLDLPDLRHTLLLESDSPSFGSASWDDPNTLTLSDEIGDEWRYDFTTNELQHSP